MDKITSSAVEEANRLIKDLARARSHLRRALRLNDKPANEVNSRLEGQLCLINLDRTGNLALSLINRLDKGMVEKAFRTDLSGEYHSLKVESPENAIALKMTEKMEQIILKEKQG